MPGQHPNNMGQRDLLQQALQRIEALEQNANNPFSAFEVIHVQLARPRDRAVQSTTGSAAAGLTIKFHDGPFVCAGIPGLQNALTGVRDLFSNDDRGAHDALDRVEQRLYDSGWTSPMGEVERAELPGIEPLLGHDVPDGQDDADYEVGEEQFGGLSPRSRPESDLTPPPPEDLEEVESSNSLESASGDRDEAASPAATDAEESQEEAAAPGRPGTSGGDIRLDQDGNEIKKDYKGYEWTPEDEIRRKDFAANILPQVVGRRTTRQSVGSISQTGMNSPAVTAQKPSATRGKKRKASDDSDTRKAPISSKHVSFSSPLHEDGDANPPITKSKSGRRPSQALDGRNAFDEVEDTDIMPRKKPRKTLRTFSRIEPRASTQQRSDDFPSGNNVHFFDDNYGLQQMPKSAGADSKRPTPRIQAPDEQEDDANHEPSNDGSTNDSDDDFHSKKASRRTSKARPSKEQVPEITRRDIH